MTDQATRVVAAGWYDDPSSDANVRWWNGVGWTDHVRPKPAVRPAEPLTGATTLPDLNSDQVKELERRFLYDDAPDGDQSPEARRARARETAQLYAAHTVTGSVWLVALSPALAAAIALAVGYFYVYVDNQPILFGLAAVPFLLTVLWAITDVRKLHDWGHEAASWLWSLLGPLVYLIARRVRVKGSTPLVAFLVSTVVIVAAPALLYTTGMTASVQTAIAVQEAVHDDLVGDGTLSGVVCPPFIDGTAVGATYTCDGTLADGRSRSVIVSIDSSDGDFSWALSLH